MSDFLTTIPRNTPWAKASIRLMKRISKHGWDKALEMELEDPYLPEDSDWCRTVAAFAAGEEPPDPQLPDSAYDFDSRFACLLCEDRGFELVDRSLPAFGYAATYGKFCSCDLGRKLRAGFENSDRQRDLQSLRGKLRRQAKEEAQSRQIAEVPTVSKAKERARSRSIARSARLDDSPPSRG